MLDFFNPQRIVRTLYICYYKRRPFLSILLSSSSFKEHPSLWYRIFATFEALAILILISATISRPILAPTHRLPIPPHSNQMDAYSLILMFLLHLFLPMTLALPTPQLNELNRNILAETEKAGAAKYSLPPLSLQLPNGTLIPLTSGLLPTPTPPLSPRSLPLSSGTISLADSSASPRT